MSIKDRVLEFGLPDWANIRKSANVLAIQDLGELAVRLGSIHIFNRRGDVLLLDSFEHGVNNWATIVDDISQSVTLSSDYSLSGSYSVKLVTGTVAIAAVGFDRFVPISSVKKVGFEASYSAAQGQMVVDLLLAVYTGTQAFTGVLRHNLQTGQVSYQNSVGTFIPLTPLVPPSPALGSFNHLKIVVDGEGGDYDHLFVNGKLFPMQNIPTNVGASNLAASAYVRVQASNINTTSKIVYIDDAIVTQNEP